MLNLQLKPLVEKLNDTCRQTLESAAGLCLSRTNYNVELEHWLSKLLEDNGADLHAILKQYGVDPSRLASDLTRAMDKLKTGNSRAPSLSPNVVYDSPASDSPHAGVEAGADSSSVEDPVLIEN